MKTDQGYGKVNSRDNKAKKNTQKGRKNQKKTNNQPSPPQTPQIQKTLSQWKGELSLTTHKRISSLHPALTTYETLLDIVERYRNDMRQNQLTIAQKSNKQLNVSPAIEIFCKKIQRFIENELEDKNKVIGSIPNSKLTQNPKDKQHSYYAKMFQHQINEKQNIFERKKNFKQYFHQHLQPQLQNVEQLINQTIGIIDAEAVDQMFLEKHEIHMNKLKNIQSEYQNNQNQHAIDIFKSISNSTALKASLRTAKRGQNIEKKQSVKLSLCEKAGLRAYFLNLHDCITE